MHAVGEYHRTDLGGWARLEPGRDGMGRAVWCHVVSDSDVSPAHLMYPSGYDDRCGWCWLGACHSDLEHDARVARATA